MELRRWRGFAAIACFLSWAGLFGVRDAPWIDLPQGQLAAIAEWDSEDLRQLDPLFEAYHAIPKDDPTRAEERIGQLEHIAGVLDRLLVDCGDDHGRYFLASLRDTARHKADYLRALLAMEKVLPDGDDGGEWDLLPLCNRRRFDPGIGQFFGEYGLELLDPCHRSLGNFYDLWQAGGGDRDRPVEFFFWLEDKNLPNWIPHWRLLTDEELARCCVTVDSAGLLRDGAGQPLQGGEKGDELIFTVDREGRLFVAHGDRLVHHVSLSGGRTLLASGTLQATNGKILQISLESGHYLPPRENGRQLVRLLRSLGIPLNGNEAFLYYNHIGMALRSTLAGEFPDLFPPGRDP
jgi:hypothetical protein